MTERALTHRPGGRQAARPATTPHRPHLVFADVEPWLDEVAPVVASLPVHGPPSAGQALWAAHTQDTALDALAVVECETFAAEAAGEPVDDLHWLHTRIAAVIAATAGRGASRAVPTAA